MCRCSWGTSTCGSAAAQLCGTSFASGGSFRRGPRRGVPSALGLVPRPLLFNSFAFYQSSRGLHAVALPLKAAHLSGVAKPAYLHCRSSEAPRVASNSRPCK